MPPLPTRLGTKPPRALPAGLKWVLSFCSVLLTVYLVTMLDRGS